MGLNNSQYDAIMRRYSDRQSAVQRTLDRHRQDAYEKIPELAKIDRDVSAMSVGAAKNLLDDRPVDMDRLKIRLQKYADRRLELLTQNGYPANYLEPEYVCPDCQDTGYIDGKKCRCFRREVVDLFYTQSGLREILEVENFEHFSYDHYPKNLVNSATGLSAREMMENTVAACKRFVEQFDTDYSNLFFYGKTGLGKTFLSHCVAKELIEREHSVIYYSASSLFEKLARNTFDHGEQDVTLVDYLFDCDLLVIDDLGAELTNAFISSSLFQILNDRIQNKRSMIISTNLTLSDFAERYTERIFSRIVNSFQLFQLYGNDIRLVGRLRRSKS